MKPFEDILNSISERLKNKKVKCENVLLLHTHNFKGVFRYFSSKIHIFEEL